MPLRQFSPCNAGAIHRGHSKFGPSSQKSLRSLREHRGQIGGGIGAKFITLFGGAAVVWLLAARAQEPARPMVGFLSSRAPVEFEPELAAFRRGLAQAGYTEHQNVGDRVSLGRKSIRTAASPGRRSDAPSSRHCCRRRSVSAIAVKAATKSIPFVFISGVDPIKLGLVDTFAKPGGNATGVNMFITAIEAKRLGLLHELIPTASRIAAIVNPKQS